MIKLRSLDVVVDDSDFFQLKHEFGTTHCVVLPVLLDISLSSLLLPMLETGPWEDKTHDGIGKEVVLRSSVALNLLHFSVNAPAFIDGVRRITGCSDISWFEGRVYRFNPGAEHHDSWHDDVGEKRLVGMSINLSALAYEGGRFHLRDRVTQLRHCEVASTVLGNAHIFRISSNLEHCVDKVLGCLPKTAFAGWFRSGQPELLSRIRMATPLPRSGVIMTRFD